MSRNGGTRGALKLPPGLDVLGVATPSSMTIRHLRFIEAQMRLKMNPSLS
jgi:hypothetical protein